MAVFICDMCLLGCVEEDIFLQSNRASLPATQLRSFLPSQQRSVGQKINSKVPSNL